MYDNNYYRVHAWLRWNFTKDNKCGFCGSTSKSKYEWALIKGKNYEKKKENFMELCIACHREYDGLIDGLTRSKMKPVIGNNDTEELKFNSIKEAAESVGRHPSCISQNLIGRSQSAAGYRWRYV